MTHGLLAGDPRVAELVARATRAAPAPAAAAAPVSVLYGGAHLFRPGAVEKLGELARRAFEAHVATDDDVCAIAGEAARPVAAAVRERVAQRLRERPLDDLRVDFEDGYGARSEVDEDGDAARVGAALAGYARTRSEGDRSAPWLGVRTKAFDADTGARAARTLLTVLEGLGGHLPPGFVVTLPKVRDAPNVALFCELLALAEAERGLSRGAIGLELMVETPEALIDATGAAALRALVTAGAGRVTSVHLGAYDLLSTLGVSASAQSLQSPLCGAARALMLLALAGTGARVVDGATTRLPLPLHRGDALSGAQRGENHAAIQGALREHAENVRAALEGGVHQGWDLHPAQLVGRYLAVYTHYLTGLAAARARLETFVAQAARASATGQAFDDAATVHGLLGFFRRGLAAGALLEGEAPALLRDAPLGGASALAV
ncbi:MAG TPA: phosphoenolpyruvate kinase [Polyangiaceae bacterium]|nr:phosphoenolpyruvate kinase [Polyangiaceae bacterium]